MPEPSDSTTGLHFDPAEKNALIGIVCQWVGEGFTTPPYGDAVYSVFEKLGIDNTNCGSADYDVRRP